MTDIYLILDSLHPITILLIVLIMAFSASCAALVIGAALSNREKKVLPPYIEDERDQ